MGTINGKSKSRRVKKGTKEHKRSKAESDKLIDHGFGVAVDRAAIDSATKSMNRSRSNLEKTASKKTKRRKSSRKTGTGSDTKITLSPRQSRRK